MNGMFSFVNTQGRRIHIKIGTVIAIFENEEKDGTFTLQCVASLWTMYEKDVDRLLAKLRARDSSVDEDPDWWKHGRPNPLDSEDDNESA